MDNSASGDASDSHPVPASRAGSPKSVTGRLRAASYGGLAGAFSATVAWFLWVAPAIFRKSPGELLRAAAFGAAVGLVIEGFRRYRELSKEEGRVSAPSSKIPAGRFLLVSAVTAFLLSTGEELLVALTDTVGSAVALSLAVFFIGGFLLGGIIAPLASPPTQRDSWTEGHGGAVLGLMVAVGGVICATPIALTITVACWIATALAGQDTSFAGLYGWWWLITVLVWVNTYFFRRGRAATWVVVSWLLIAGIVFGSLRGPPDTRGRGSWVLVLGATSVWALAGSPDVPAKEWYRADHEMRSIGLSPVAGPKVGKHLLMSDLRCGQNISLRADPPYLTQDDLNLYLGLRDRLCTELAVRGVTRIDRSTLVSICFAFLVPIGLVAERRRRRADYEHSPNAISRRLDRTMLTLYPLVIAILIAYSRLVH